MTMNAIASITVDLKAVIKYEIPKSGSFIFVYHFNGYPFSATYAWRNGELAVMTDTGWEIAGSGCADEYYQLEDLERIAAGGCTSTKFIAVIVVE